MSTVLWTGGSSGDEGGDGTIAQVLWGARDANYVPGWSLARSADAVIEFDLCLSCPLYCLH